jgi:hypothetical protein
MAGGDCRRPPHLVSDTCSSYELVPEDEKVSDTSSARVAQRRRDACDRAEERELRRLVACAVAVQ